MRNETTTRVVRFDSIKNERLQSALRRDVRAGADDPDGLCAPLRRRPQRRQSFDFDAYWEAWLVEFEARMAARKYPVPEVWHWSTHDERGLRLGPGRFRSRVRRGNV